MKGFEKNYPVSYEHLGKCAMRCFVSNGDGVKDISFGDFQSDDPDIEDKMVIWGAIENYGYSGAQGLASDLYSDIEDVVLTVMKAIKAKIVADVIDGKFPDDANNIDMNHLLESGLKLLENETGE